MSATEEEEGQDEEMAEAPPTAAPKQEEEQEQSMIREAAIGKGTLVSSKTHTTSCENLWKQPDLQPRSSFVDGLFDWCMSE